jgi:hypothetical protein
MPSKKQLQEREAQARLDNELAIARREDPDYLPFSWLKQAASVVHKHNASIWAPSRERRLPRGTS